MPLRVLSANESGCFEARIADRFLEIGALRHAGIVGNSCLPGIERYLHPLYSGQSAQNGGHARGTVLTVHAGDSHHRRLACRIHSFPLRSIDSRRFQATRFSYDACHETDHLPPGRQRFKSNELNTTETELMAIAAPAITGFNIPSAARGMPSML